MKANLCIVENDKNRSRNDLIRSTKIRAGKRRTYFIDVKKTKGEDYYISITESTKRFDDEGYEKHKIFIYKEDFNRFYKALDDIINFVKKDLMPDFDFEEYDRRQEEFEKRRQEEWEKRGQEESGNTAPETNSDEVTW